ncbi:MAG TPA: hypothetical protein VK557_01910 [Pyrinomonadaceae bacterium]|nr:hypothetical protein [Pyrinomonadaceae bacterium]
MKTPSGTFALKLVVLAASAAALIVLISACKKSSVLGNQDRPILIIFMPPGAITKHSDDEVKTAFQNLGQAMCNVDYYDKNQVKKWHEGTLTLIGAIRSEASENQASVDPINVTQKATFASLDEATDFLTKIK